MIRQPAQVAWYVFRDGRQHGPLSDPELMALWSQQKLLPTDLIWRDGFADWQLASSVLGRTPPPPVPENARRRASTAENSLPGNSGLRTEGITLFGGVKVIGAVGIAAVAATIAFYAEIVTKTHDAACRLLPVFRISAEQFGCSSDGQKTAKAVENVGKNVDKANRGIERLEVGTGTINQTTKATDERAQAIEKKVDAINKASDPKAIARHAITTAGYSIDNEGFIKAVAQGSEVTSHFKEFGVHGDAASLRRALLANKVSSKEYQHLAGMMAAAHSEHYAAPLREEIKSLFATMQEKRTVAPLRKMACETANAEGFIETLVRNNLAANCKDESRWLERSIEFAKNTLLYLQATEAYMWWGVSARREVTYKPTSVSTKAVPLNELVSKIQRGLQRTADEYVRVNAPISLRQESMGPSSTSTILRRARWRCRCSSRTPA